MGYIVAIVGQQKWIKRTSRFGPFYGNIVLTENIKEARVWTREVDAVSAAHTLEYRTNHERARERDRKFGPLRAIVQQEPIENSQ